jgi:hypothetical protein
MPSWCIWPAVAAMSSLAERRQARRLSFASQNSTPQLFVSSHSKNWHAAHLSMKLTHGNEPYFYLFSNLSKRTSVFMCTSMGWNKFAWLNPQYAMHWQPAIWLIADHRAFDRRWVSIDFQTFILSENCLSTLDWRISFKCYKNEEYRKIIADEIAIEPICCP